MLLPDRIVEQLQNKLAGFRAYDGDYQKELAAYQKALAALSQSDAAALHDKLDGKEEAQAEAFARNLLIPPDAGQRLVTTGKTACCRGPLP